MCRTLQSSTLKLMLTTTQRVTVKCRNLGGQSATNARKTSDRGEEPGRERAERGDAHASPSTDLDQHWRALVSCGSASLDSTRPLSGNIIPTRPPQPGGSASYFAGFGRLHLKFFLRGGLAGVTNCEPKGKSFPDWCRNFPALVGPFQSRSTEHFGPVGLDGKPSSSSTLSRGFGDALKPDHRKTLVCREDFTDRDGLRSDTHSPHTHTQVSTTTGGPSRTFGRFRTWCVRHDLHTWMPCNDESPAPASSWTLSLVAPSVELTLRNSCTPKSGRQPQRRRNVKHLLTCLVLRY